MPVFKPDKTIDALSRSDRALCTPFESHHTRRLLMSQEQSSSLQYWLSWIGLQSRTSRLLPAYLITNYVLEYLRKAFFTDCFSKGIRGQDRMHEIESKKLKTDHSSTFLASTQFLASTRNPANSQVVRRTRKSIINPLLRVELDVDRRIWLWKNWKSSNLQHFTKHTICDWNGLADVFHCHKILNPRTLWVYFKYIRQFLL